MSVHVRVIEKEDETFQVQRVNNQGAWIDVGTPYASTDEDKAVKRADRVFARLNRPAGDAVVYYLA